MPVNIPPILGKCVIFAVYPVESARDIVIIINRRKSFFQLHVHALLLVKMVYSRDISKYYAAPKF